MAFPTNVVSCTSDDVFNNVDTVLNESSAQGRCELLKAQEDRYAKRCYSFCDFTESITFSMGAPGECVSAVQGKKGVWIKVPTEQARLVPIAIDAGFLYHRAEPSYVMLVYWILQTPSTIPDNASHQVGIAAFLFNDKGEVLVVQEKCGLFKISGLWKMPTGRTNQGEGIKEGAIGEVQEETGISRNVAFGLSNSYRSMNYRDGQNGLFGKSDMLFVCMLKSTSCNIVKLIQETEISAA
ncbi:nudix hydrolase 2-like [Cryptomeria japonica]|uniref:nudix hydrolase 2-like n=1 Tax=Cryptomeria japonica TaxID=3369 RepID=UPI0027DA6C9B|nr:nudix hydrolase 2-like [Cryptomeria japonica]